MQSGRAYPSTCPILSLLTTDLVSNSFTGNDHFNTLPYLIIENTVINITVSVPYYTRPNHMSGRELQDFMKPNKTEPPNSFLFYQ